MHVRRFVTKHESGQSISAVRRIQQKRHSVDVGTYYCGFSPLCGYTGPLTSIRSSIPFDLSAGRSVTYTMSQPYAYNSARAVVGLDADAKRTPTCIEYDVSIDESIPILSRCKRAKRGVVIAADAAMPKDEPDLSLVADAPVRQVGRRPPHKRQAKARALEYEKLTPEELMTLAAYPVAAR